MVISRVPGRSSLPPLRIGAPEVLSLAEGLGIVFPTEPSIVAMKREHPYHIREVLNAWLNKALPLCLGMSRQILGV